MELVQKAAGDSVDLDDTMQECSIDKLLEAPAPADKAK